MAGAGWGRIFPFPWVSQALGYPNHWAQFASFSGAQALLGEPEHDGVFQNAPFTLLSAGSLQGFF